jgi:hypothetical protein
MRWDRDKARRQVHAELRSRYMADAYTRELEAAIARPPKPRMSFREARALAHDIDPARIKRLPPTHAKIK